MKLPTEKEQIILQELVNNPGVPLYAKALAERSDELRASSIYVLMTRMVARGYVTQRYETPEEREKWPGRGPPRQVYEITDYGRQSLNARKAAIAAKEKVERRMNVPKPSGSLA